MAVVVNVKVNHIRPAYNDLQQWMSDDTNNVYIGRANVVFINGKRYPPTSSMFANPYKIGKDGNRHQVLEKYEQYMTNKIQSDVIVRDELLKLKGKYLGCWCAPEPCHGNVLVSLINKYSST